MKISLQNKTAVVSGSSGGIGQAIALSLANAGARTTVIGRKAEKVAAVVKEIESAADEHVDLIPLTADLTTVEGVESLKKAVPDADIVVNNLGIYDFRDFNDYDDADWQRYFDINIMSGVRLSRFYLPGMQKRNWGRVMFISSESAIHIPATMIPYAMTKTAQIAIARGLAEHVKGTNITVNSVLAGPTWSDSVSALVVEMAKEAGVSVEEMKETFIKENRNDSLIQRFLDPKEIADAVTFLASDQASGMNGAPVRVEGGAVRAAV